MFTLVFSFFSLPPPSHPAATSRNVLPYLYGRVFLKRRIQRARTHTNSATCGHENAAAVIVPGKTHQLVSRTDPRSHAPFTHSRKNVTSLRVITIHLLRYVVNLVFKNSDYQRARFYVCFQNWTLKRAYTYTADLNSHTSLRLTCRETAVGENVRRLCPLSHNLNTPSPEDSRNKYFIKMFQCGNEVKSSSLE